MESRELIEAKILDLVSLLLLLEEESFLLLLLGTPLFASILVEFVEVHH